MVRRDPETGKFVSTGSSAGLPWHETERISGVVKAVIPAADLAGGQTGENLQNSNVELIDFGRILDNDEVFRLEALDTTAILTMPNTATAESYAEASYAVSSQVELGDGELVDSTFWGLSPHYEEGPVDVRKGNEEVPNHLVVGELQGYNQLADSAAGLAGGGDVDRDRQTVWFDGKGPVYDRDDDLFAPFDMRIDNASDHAISLHVSALAHGYVEELD